MKEFQILKIQQIIDYREDRKHAHFLSLQEENNFKIENKRRVQHWLEQAEYPPGPSSL